MENKQEKTFEDVLDESLAKGKILLDELKAINAKRETLEESAEKYAKSKTSHKTFQETYKRDFIAGG